MDTLTYGQLIDEIQKIPVIESRISSPSLQEFVMNTDFITPIHLIFQDFFGEDFKAPGENPTPQDKKRAAFLGGVREYQTLYYAEKEGSRHCAMLWPWSDGRRCTVKIAYSPI